MLPTFESAPEKFVIEAASRRGDRALSLRK
jgi:hypothetical protein